LIFCVYKNNIICISNPKNNKSSFNYVIVFSINFLNLLAMKSSDVSIIGGGLAGLTAAIHLLNGGFTVIVFEKNEFPKHKVCGEYISNEVLPYLKSLGLDVESLQPKHINKLSFSLVSGKIITASLPLGGFGLSRYALDNYLYQQVKERGGTVLQENVTDVTFAEDKFTVTTQNHSYISKLAFGAFGKRSNLDIKWHRNFIKQPSNWLGVKAHYTVSFADDVVGLHHFKGGYCGVSKVEDDLVNICYLGNYETFKKYKNIQEYQENVVCENPNLKAIFDNAAIQFENPLTISQISFEKKDSVENHMLMIGDTAGLIHPLCGNGMAMAIHSAKLASEVAMLFLENKISRSQMEKKYSQLWNFNFKSRMRAGRRLGSLLQQEKLASVVMNVFTAFPFLLPIVIRKTHGKPL
jgi:flavin-dependent dehydrogenase